VEEVINK